MKNIKDFCFAAIVIIIAVTAVPFTTKAQSVHNEQYIALQNWTNTQYKITFGAPNTLFTNYTFLLPDSTPTALDQTLTVTSLGPTSYSLGWRNPTKTLAWLLNGNSGTNPLTNFIGSIDAQDFVTRTNNIERMRVTSAGNVVIGTILNPGLLQLQGTVGSNTFTTGGAQLLNINYTLPTTAPSSNGQILSSTTGGVMSWAPASSGVTSVGLAMPSIFTVSGSPVTSSGTLTAALTTEGANLVFAGPTTGAAATPTFRALGTGDIPNLSGSYIVNGTSLQTPANFNISGNGTINGNATIGLQLQLKGTSTGMTTFQAGAQTTNINYTLPITAPTADQILSSNATGALSWTSVSSGVTSVGLAMPSIFSVSGSPVTSSGTLTATLVTEGANLVFAGPTTGAAATPTFRALGTGDIPNLSGSYIVNGTSLQTPANFHISGNGEVEGKIIIKGTSTGTTTFAAGAQGTTDINYTLPTAQGAAGTVLGNNGSGVLSWVDESSNVGSVKFAIKGSDQSISNSTTLTNDNALSFSIGANETWELVAQLDATTDGEDDNAPKFDVAVTIPSGTLHVYAYGDGGDDVNGDWLTTSGTANVDDFEISDENEEGPIVLQGLIVGGSTGGTVHIQWAPSTSSTSSVTVKTNSYLKATRAK